jgi:hypothetical protein
VLQPIGATSVASTLPARYALPEGGGGRTDPAQIERDYQVQTEEMIEYSAKAFGWISLGGLGGTQNVTATEGKLLDQLTRDRGLLGLKGFDDMRTEVFDTSEARVPLATSIPPHAEAQIAQLPPEQQQQARDAYPTNDGHTDAFRHAYWNARMTSEYGAEWTQQFATAHEGAPGNPAVREAMDLYNNEVGRQIAAENPGASPEELADATLEALNDGRLVVVDRSGHLAYSNEVARNDHGVTDPTVGEGGPIGTPDGDAYTSS